jgi:hypothetical protein
MKTFHTAALIVGTISALTFSTLSPASAAENFAFSFNTGDVAFAYTDGYWDQNRQWHGWSNDRERNEYRRHHGQNYKHMKHSRYKGQGWRRDQDHDGIPNRFDNDRDGDGRSNRHDDAPNNPNRR